MSSTTITNNNPLGVAEDFNVSSDLPLQLASSLRQNTVSITPSVSTSASTVSESSQTSVTPSEQGDTDATPGSNTIFGISFPSPPPPKTSVENCGGISVSSKPPPKSGWTGEYSDPGTPVNGTSKLDWTGEYSQSDPGTPITSMSKLGWTGEYSTSGVEPEYLMARLSTVANKSEDEPDKAQNEDEETSSGESSETERDSTASIVRGINSEEEEVAKLARQAVWRVTPRSVMESLDIKQVKSGVVTITNSVAQPQSAVLCNIEDELVPEARETVVFSPTGANSTKDAEIVKREKTGTMGCMASCMSAFKMGSRSKPQVPVNQPKHATLLPGKSCLKPTSSLAGTVLDRTEEDSPIQPVPAPKTPKGAKVTFKLDEAADGDESKPRPRPKRKSRSHFNFNILSQLFSKNSNEDTQDRSDEEEIDDPDSPFAAQDLEIQRRLARADVHRDANERTSILRGALDFLLVVCDRVDTVAADRNSDLLNKTGDRCLGSYTGEEKDHVNPHQYANKVDKRLYRSKETAMSYSRRR
ncbi:uncharacterized protein FMAN_03365 [Fusarium mangiferae]|uniref:Uncharacterized protein n=1 Tax=Fusarium mangiferae TaxID=192010 RepID=A0A1L7T6B1_FUSMA|nr:uncharacterized protein FMAN_03365 [Fusarium mangiferae]CVK94144.1 uncharacterized protein FMAN_03365 [Fusarium mangiferae]